MKAESLKIAEDIALFLENGGVINDVEYQDEAEKAARVGRWEYMGDPIHDQIELRKYGEDLIDTVHDEDLMLNEQERDLAILDAMRDSYDYFPIDMQEEWGYE